MRAVTKRLFATVFAAAEEYPLAYIRCVFEGRNAGILVAAIAERLLAALATGAPEVVLAFFDFDGIGRFLSDDWCGHFVPFVAVCSQR